ncbi:MAG: SDR family NAD(P)-dependent oxidoreductase [Sagittula sp.]|uniref:SDR family NAD(P)-dependent oxidoreductase n=1 Tax=Sagittula sp. TaxID=2038081 RepID=UPI00405A32C5
MSALRLDGRVALVTGAGRGLGRVFARALSERGATVICLGRGGGGEDAVAAEITGAGGRAETEIADVADGAAVQAMAGRVLERHGRLDILVNNAGMTRDRSFGKVDMDDFRAVVDTNLIGTAQVTAAFWPAMLAQGHGRVVFLTSAAGLAGNFGQAAYSAAKMGLVGLMQTLGMEGGRKGVHVNCLSPVGVTEMNRDILPPDLLPRLGAEHLAPGLVFLASDAAPNRVVLMGGAGSFECAEVRFTRGRAAATAEDLAARFAEVSDGTEAVRPDSAMTQLELELANVG